MGKIGVLKRIAVILAIILVVLYFIWIIFQATINDVKTETASMKTVSDTIDTVGYFIRNEQFVTQKDKGFVSFTVDNGGKVGKNEAVANIFANAEEATNKLLMDRLHAELTALEQLEQSSDSLSATPDLLDKQIDTQLASVNVNLVKGDFGAVSGDVNSVLYTLNERQIVTGTVVSFSDKIKELKNRITELEQKSSIASTGKQATAPAAGYFTSTIDGYENVIPADSISELKPGDLNMEKISKSVPPDNAIGRIMTGVNWYIACQITSEEALQIQKENLPLKVQIPSVSNQEIDVSIESVNQESTGADAVVILRGSYMDSDIIDLRYENISIVIHSYKGIYIPKTAVHEVSCTFLPTGDEQETKTKEALGVYIRVGNEIQFKRIIEIYTGDNYVIAEPFEISLPSIEEDYDQLMLNDEIVVEGVNLYHGKIIKPKGTSI